MTPPKQLIKVMQRRQASKGGRRLWRITVSVEEAALIVPDQLAKQGVLPGLDDSLRAALHGAVTAYITGGQTLIKRAAEGEGPLKEGVEFSRAR